MTFGRYITDERKKAGLSQKDLAALIQKEDGTAISPQYLNDIEHDRRGPPPSYIIDQLATALKVPREYLYFLAGQLPADLRESGNATEPEKVREAFRAFRRELRRNNDAVDS
ncbi:MAG: helix-turn-helix domain-containing protein [Chloroflexi bacterium]|nr:helix-turn-helix domain-containing protein [Chloroflexota bacterium]